MINESDLFIDEPDKKALLRETFNIVADGYDALRFFPKSARLLAEQLGLRGDEHVLDVATGTGHAALAISRLLPRGHVTGVDFAAGMIEQARRKASALNITNIDFIKMDMQSLNFPERSFDAVTCAFAIFFADDIETQLSQLAAVVRPGGKIAISGFQKTLFRPLIELFFQRLNSYGIETPEPDWMRIATESRCRQLFKAAGISNVEVKMGNVGYFIDSADEWWKVIWNAGFRRLVNRIPDKELGRFRLEHMEEIAALKTRDGIWLDIGVIYSVGTRP
ncbi:MAG: class I SAM-dependent methyltransferase [Thermoleophilia bacterium]|nr:class I SAM-dependent methyltransferase [Thermoleophilia bacterium]